MKKYYRSSIVLLLDDGRYVRKEHHWVTQGNVSEEYVLAHHVSFWRDKLAQRENSVVDVLPDGIQEVRECLGILYNRVSPPEFQHDDGEWTLLSLGMLIQVMVDGGDVAAFMRVLEDRRLSEKKFSRRMEIILAPNGYVLEEAKRVGCDRVHKVIGALIEGGLVK